MNRVFALANLDGKYRMDANGQALILYASLSEADKAARRLNSKLADFLDGWVPVEMRAKE